PEQKNQLDPRITGPQSAERIHGVGWSRALELHPLHAEPRRLRHGELEHRRPVRRGCAVSSLLERLFASGDKAKGFEPQRFGSDLAHDEMSVVNRIERSAEEPDHLLSRPRRYWRDTLQRRPRLSDGIASGSRRSPARLPCTRVSDRPAPA